MKTLALVCLAALCAAPSFAANRCDHWPAEGAGPTREDVRGCWVEDLYGLIEAQGAAASLEDLDACLAGGPSIEPRLTRDGLELTCRFSALTWKTAVSARKLQEADLSILPVGLGPRPGVYSLVKRSELRGVENLRGSDLLRAFENAQVDDAMIAQAVSRFEHARRRALQAQRLRSFLDSQPKL